MRQLKILLGLAALGLALVPGAAAAEGQLQCDESKFLNAGTELDVCVFVDPQSDGTEIRILLLGIQSPDSHRISVTFDKTQTAALLQLWRTAVGSQSAAWRRVGEFAETGQTDNSRLTVSAGPGVRMAIQSPARGSYTSEIPAADVPRFTSTLEKAVTFVAGSI